MGGQVWFYLFGFTCPLFWETIITIVLLDMLRYILFVFLS